MNAHFAFIACTLLFTAMGQETPIQHEARDIKAYENTSTRLAEHLGKPVFLRAVKEDLLLELWVQTQGTWALFKSYPILGMSGELGPKTQEGDYQAPEGFYYVIPSFLNPKSNYHLSFDIGYPNKYDKSLGRTGNLIMIHGSNLSAGCLAVGDEAIEEVYTMVALALKKGQKQVPVHIYPFEMTPERMEREQESPHHAHWRYLEAGWRHTHEKQEPYPAAN